MNRDFIVKIYNEHYGLIELIVKNSIHTSNYDDITACVQDVFMVAMQKEGLEEHANIKAWLLKTAKNVVNTFNRQRATRNKYFDFNADFMTAEPMAADFSDLLIDKIDFERFKSMNIDQIIMDSLTLNERDFYILLRFNKLSAKEISKVLSISEGSAATRRTRLKEKIKIFLENL